MWNSFAKLAKPAGWALLSAQMFLSVSGAGAQEWTDNLTYPSYFQVSGVAANDVLNVRMAPDSSSQVLGSLAPNAGPVEVFRVDGVWAQVALPEGMGWVSGHFLSPVQLQNIGDSALPEGLECGGTEPFWNLVMGNGQLNYSALGADDQSLVIFESGRFSNAGDSLNFVLAQGTGVQMSGIVSNQLCSDGMSDRTYPRRIDLLISSPDGTSGLSGCCNVSLAR